MRSSTRTSRVSGAQASRPQATPYKAQALPHYEQALPIQRQIGDRHGEAVTRYNIAMIYRANGQLKQPITELELVVELDRQISHPDLASDSAMLEHVRLERAQQNDEI
jgi:tetratricopeptide (TPR) repeat protein